MRLLRTFHNINYQQIEAESLLVCKLAWYKTSGYDVLFSHLRYQILETGNDVGALEFLVVAETASHNDHSDESDGQIKLQRHRQWSPLGD